jgi:hypothetical protein
VALLAGCGVSLETELGITPSVKHTLQDARASGVFNPAMSNFVPPLA